MSMAVVKITTTTTVCEMNGRQLLQFNQAMFLYLNLLVCLLWFPRNRRQYVSKIEISLTLALGFLHTHAHTQTLSES